jgi:hypothetical protein
VFKLYSKVYVDSDRYSRTGILGFLKYAIGLIAIIFVDEGVSRGLLIVLLIKSILEGLIRFAYDSYDF